MRREIRQVIEIPENVQISLDGKTSKNLVKIKGPLGEVERDFPDSFLIEVKGKELILEHKKATKKEKKSINTTKAHLLNMIQGVQEKFKYTLKICFAHFPVTATVDKDNLIVKNFLGERKARIAKIVPGVEVTINGNIITVESINMESAGQTSANIEKTTNIRNRDRRVFQDGIFITEKPGRRE